MHLTWIDYSIIILYFLFVIGIGFFIKKRIKNTHDFLMGGRSIPLWISSLAFISANLGAQEVIGMAASGAKYGMITAHLYWLGAIPAMVFLGIFMMPFYYNSRVRSVPEYLFLRFDEKTRALNALSFAAMTLFSSGISLYALALLLKTLLGWSFETSILLSAGVVMIYTFLGGLTSAIYNEVFQFFLIILGITPIVVIGILQLGGWNSFLHQVPEEMTHIWKHMSSAQDNAMGVNAWSMSLGLGFVLSFGYWCTDFLVIQRAMVSQNKLSAQRTPLIAAIPKMILPFIVVLPGLIAIALQNTKGGFSLPLKADHRIDYDMTLPLLLAHFFPTGLLGVGLTALMASFMSGMAGNVTAFNSVFTFDIYQAYFKKSAPDHHYLRVGKIATLCGILLSVGTAYLARSFNNILDLLQLVFGFVNAPLFATFLLGMFWKRTTSDGAFWGLLAGTLSAASFHGLTLAEQKGSWLTSHPLYEFQSVMGQAFGVAIVSWSTCFLMTLLVTLFTVPKKDSELQGLVYSLPDPSTQDPTFWLFKPAFLGVIVLLFTLILNYLWY